MFFIAGIERHPICLSSTILEIVFSLRILRTTFLYLIRGKEGSGSPDPSAIRSPVTAHVRKRMEMAG